MTPFEQSGVSTLAKQPKALNREAKPRDNSGVKHKKNPQTPINLILMNKGLMVGVTKRYAPSR